MIWVGSVEEEAEEDWFVSSLDGVDEGRSPSSFLFQIVSSGQALFHLGFCGGREQV